MVILISFLVVLLCFSFGYNLYHATEFRCFQFLVDENNELEHKIKECDLDRLLIVCRNEDLENQLKYSEANRELKGKRINYLMKENETLKVKILRLDLILRNYDKSIPEFRTNLTYSDVTHHRNILQKYVNYAGYKHLDIKFTKEEKLILKNLE